LVDLLAIKDLSARTLRGSAAWAAPSIQVMLNGSGDATCAPEMTAFIALIEERARHLRAHSIVFDVREVSLLSSSCLSPFVALVVNNSELPRPERMRIEFRIASARWWQDRSFAAIRALSPELVQITAVRAA
jgi:hypothetical protein